MWLVDEILLIDFSIYMLLIDNIDYAIVTLVRVIFWYIDIQNINCLFNGRESLEFVPLYIMKILVYT